MLSHVCLWICSATWVSLPPACTTFSVSPLCKSPAANVLVVAGPTLRFVARARANIGGSSDGRGGEERDVSPDATSEPDIEAFWFTLIGGFRVDRALLLNLPWSPMVGRRSGYRE